MSQQINLFHSKFRKQIKLLSANEAVLGLLLIAVSAFGHAVVLWEQNESLALEARSVDLAASAEQAIADQLGAAAKTHKKDAQLEAAAIFAEQQVQSMRDAMQLIGSGALGNAEGYSDKMRALARQSVPGLWLTGFTFAGDTEENVIRGRTLDGDLVAVYLRRLNEEKTFQGQRFATLTISTPKDQTPVDEQVATGAGKDQGLAKPTNVRKPLAYLEFSVAAANAKLPVAKP